jgi:hypothetical protein
LASSVPGLAARLAGATDAACPQPDPPAVVGIPRVDHHVQLGDTVDAVIDSGDCGTEPTTVIDLSQDEPEILRRGAGDTSGFE